MQGLFYTILIALANNADNIGVRIAYSIRGIKLGTCANLWISGITFAVSTAFACLGAAAAGAAGARACSILSLLILAGLGLWFILEPILQKPARAGHKQKKDSLFSILTDPEKSDLDHSKTIDFKEATLLGASLCMNNAAGSLSAGMMGLNAVLIGVFSALISFAALWAGNFLTSALLKRNLGRKANIASGVILIVIGILQML